MDRISAALYYINVSTVLIESTTSRFSYWSAGNKPRSHEYILGGFDPHTGIIFRCVEPSNINSRMQQAERPPLSGFF